MRYKLWGKISASAQHNMWHYCFADTVCMTVSMLVMFSPIHLNHCTKADECWCAWKATVGWHLLWSVSPVKVSEGKSAHPSGDTQLSNWLCEMKTKTQHGQLNQTGYTTQNTFSMSLSLSHTHSSCVFGGVSVHQPEETCFWLKRLKLFKWRVFPLLLCTENLSVIGGW